MAKAESDVKDGIHIPTGLIAQGEYMLVAQNCLACHSAKLITQNKMDKTSWQATIQWMQETQNLWDLGPNEEKIVDYLATFYKPTKIGRRKPLIVEEWYMIE